MHPISAAFDLHRENTSVQVLAIGNALVDILANTEDSFLQSHELQKGGMMLVSPEQALKLYDDMAPSREVSGGSAANTVVGLAGAGMKTAFIGKIAADTLGHIFAHDLKASHVDFRGVTVSTPDSHTGRCYVLVTPDAQRTMCTCLGVSGSIYTQDIDDSLVCDSAILYFEGYLWDLPQTKDALRHAINVSHTAGRSVAMSLSDPFWVSTRREEFLQLIEQDIDIIFGNEDEYLQLFAVEDLDSAVEKAKQIPERLWIITRGAEGCAVLYDGQLSYFPAQKVNPKDTTGAGDFFAAGFLYGMFRDYSLADCAKAGSVLAAEIISHFGARPEESVEKTLQAANL